MTREKQGGKLSHKDGIVKYLMDHPGWMGQSEICMHLNLTHLNLGLYVRGIDCVERRVISKQRDGVEYRYVEVVGECQ